jgi:translation initiation factor 3 subunit A
MTQEKENQLTVIVERAQLDKTKADYILETFKAYFSIAAEWEVAVKDLVVTDESQTDLMAKAKKGRLALKDKRVELERTRKNLKEQSLREGKAIDGIANVLKGLIEPLEDHLEKQEKFIEIREAERKRKLGYDRFVKIQQYIELPNLQYKFSEMTEEVFNLLYDAKKKAYEEKIEFEKKLSAEKIAKEKADIEEREKTRQEIIRLKAEAEKKERIFSSERDATKAKYEAERAKQARILSEQKAKADVERRAIEEKARKEREKQARILEAERKEKERLIALQADALANCEKMEKERQEMLKNNTVTCPNCQHKFVIE